MQLIDVAERPAVQRPLATGEMGEAALAGLIAEIGNAGFGANGLAHINGLMPICWWSIYRLFDDAPPQVHAMGCFQVPDGTMRSWQVYRESLYLRDETFHPARERLTDGRVGLVHMHATEIPSQHRAEIYSRNGLRERLSVVLNDQNDGGLLAINLYRHQTQAGFSDADIDIAHRFSRPLLACVQRHIALHGRIQPGNAVLAQLTTREREVCERLLKGWTHDGIAADLGVSAATVKTYRNRAFERLGIHHRNELFALAVAGLPS